MKFEIYKQQSERFDAGTEYRWRLKARNGRIIACSGEGYKNRSHCKKMIKTITQWSGGAVIVYI